MEKKKKHVFGKLLLGLLAVIIAVILIVPIAAWCYLRASTFTEEQPVLTEETGTAAVDGKGFMTVSFTPWELQQIFERDYFPALRETVEKAGPFRIDSAELVPKNGGTVIYLDVTALGFVPAHLRITADAAVKAGVADVTVTEVLVGKRLSIPLEELRSRFGIDPHLQPAVPEFSGSKPDTVTFGENDIRAEFGDTGLGAAAECLAEELKKAARPYAYLAMDASAMPDEMANVLTAETEGKNLKTFLRTSVLSAPDPVDAYLRYLGYVPQAAETLSRSKLNDYAVERLLKGTEKKAAACRTEAENRFIACVAPYKSLLDRTEEAWCELAFKIGKNTIDYEETGGRFPPDIDYPEELLDGEDYGVYMMMSTSATWPVHWVELPRLAELRFSSAASYEAKKMFFFGMGMTVYVQLPCGIPALLYYQHNGNFVICSLDHETLKDFKQEFGLPYVPDEGVPRPPARPAPFTLADGLVLELLILE